MNTIMLVDDDRVLRQSLSATLSGLGFRVICCADGADAVARFDPAAVDLVLLDVMMPRLDGYATCTVLRGKSRDTPIIFLSALGEVPDQVRGFEAGADDYVEKSAPKEILLARIRSAFARIERLTPSAAPSSMTRTEAAIYRLLASDRGHVFSYREIAAAICGEGYRILDGALRATISRLRAKLPEGETVQAHRGRGFVLARAV